MPSVLSIYISCSIPILTPNNNQHIQDLIFSLSKHINIRTLQDLFKKSNLFLNSLKLLWLSRNLQFTTVNLWSTDVTGRVPHQSLTRGAASDMAARTSVSRLRFLFLFFIFFSLGFAPTWLDLRRTGPIWPKLGHIGQRPKRTKMAETCWNWRWIMPEQPKSALNEAQTS